jgi:hypothetical protein
VAKKLARGVPKCGVFIVVTLARRDLHESFSAETPSVTLGDATSRASSPPVE